MNYESYAQQVEAQKRRRQLARMLTEGSMSNDRINAVDGVVVPYTMGEGLAKLGQAFIGARAERKADKEEKDLARKRSEDIAAALSSYERATPDQEVNSEILRRIESTPDGQLMEPVTGKSDARRRLALELMPANEAMELEMRRELYSGRGSQGVQSTVVGDDGYYYTVDRLTGEMTNTGVKSAPNMRVIEQEGNVPFGVVTGRGQPGKIMPLAGGPGAPSGGPAPMRQPTAGERQRDIETAKADVELATKPTIASATTEAEKRTEHTLQKEFDRPAARSRLDATNQKLDLFIRKAGDIEKDPSLSRATGMMAYIPSVFGGGAKNTENAIEALKGQLGFNELQDMRANSPTGGALGNVTERELTFLQNSLLSLERSQSPEQYRANLRDLITYTKGIKDRLNRAFEETYAQARPSGAPQPGAIEDGYRFNGGDPADPANWEPAQ